MILQSIFGDAANSLQFMIDNSLDRFAPTWYQRYFGFAPQQSSLSFTEIIGRSRIEAAASVVDRDSRTPQRSRAQLEKLTGEIPAIKESFKMTESDYRDYRVMQTMPVSDAARLEQTLDIIFNDVMKVATATDKRIDIMVLEAISTGKISLSTINNPDGIILTDDIDLLMPNANRKQGAVSWATSATATPITDIEAVIEDATARGISFSKILMSRALWLKFKNTTQVINTMKDYYYGPKSGSGSSAVAVTTLENVNGFMDANQLPVIEIVDETIGIEKDGFIGTIKPFNQNAASFIPSGQLGVIKNALAIEQFVPVSGVSYANYNRTLVSKWSENEPFGEWTKAELNAFPAVTAIDSMYILTAVFG